MAMTQDFRKVLLNVNKHLNSSNLEQLNFFFGRANEPNDSAIKLFEFLMSQGIISDQNVSQLIEGLDFVQLRVAAEELEAYEKGLKISSVSHIEIFVGRDEEMACMQDHLEDIKNGQYGFRAIFITGLAGVGKTYLAEEFQRRESDTKVFNRMFISCRELKTALGVKNLIMENFCISIDREQLFKIFARNLRSCTNTMIVLDNLEDVMEHDGAKFDELILNLCDAASTVRQRSHCLLMTSRRRLSPDTEKKLANVLLPIILENMNERDSLELLDSYLGQRNLSREEKRSLMKYCGQHTLSMALVASRLKHSPQVPFDLVADEMKRKPLVTLTNIEFLDILNTQSCVESSLYNTFVAMDPASQDLLVRLSVATDSIRESTAKNLYRDPSSSRRDAFSESLIRLLELNFVKSREALVAREGGRRFNIHLLIRAFVASYCSMDDCPLALRTAHDEAQELLLLAYMNDMKRLSDTEWSNPKSYNREIEVERLNLSPALPRVFDLMLKEHASLNDFDRVCRVSRNFVYAAKDRVNFFQERKKAAARLNSPDWAVAYMELRFADEIRLAGHHDSAREAFERVKRLLDGNAAMTADQRAWLEANYFRYYGRFLKDQSRGDFRRALKKSVRYLKDARDRFNNPALFADVERYLAEAHFDLGNAYKIYGDNDMCDRVHLYTEARKAFDAARIIYENADPRIVHLFDVYLSLAACDMELKSLLTSVDGYEDKMSLAPALEFYNKAELVAKANGDIIRKDPSRMGYMYYSRCVCHTRARDYKAAHADAQRSLRLRLDALGCHNQTMNCYMMLGEIYSRDARLFRRHNQQALNAFEKALDMAQVLVSKGADVNSTDMERLYNSISIMCHRLDKDDTKYEEIIEAVNKRDLAKLELEKIHLEFDSDEEKDIRENARRIRNDVTGYSDSSSDSDADSEDGSAPRCSEARDLADQLKGLMSTLAERLEYLSHEMDVVDMEILVDVLRDGYPNMKPDARNARYEKGKRLYSHLVNLRENPGSVIQENRKKRAKR